MSQRASDVHFCPEKNDVRTEVRIHGVLQELERISLSDYEDLVRNIKFVAKLKLNISNIPQDGQYSVQTGEGESVREMHIRTATMPAKYGEKLTLRFLDPQRGIKPLSELGFDKQIESSLAELATLPNGLILITGPTGSGKTTTLYALLNSLIGTARNIITLEDPIEYELPGIVQSEVDVDHDYTFATGLRSILRHDPDVILVGEIRDSETAQTAVDAALTGHLVLSTLHTNSAIEAIPRLLSMGVSPYTFAPSLRGILAQRLVRTVKGGQDLDPTDPDSYSGQCAIGELLVCSSAIQNQILEGELESTILETAKSEGFTTLEKAGNTLVTEGKTLQAEVERVTG